MRRCGVECYSHLEIDGRQNYCNECHIEWCQMCNENYSYWYSSEEGEWKRNVAGSYCARAFLCAVYHKARFSIEDGKRGLRPNWQYWLLVLAALVTYPVWGLAYGFYFGVAAISDLLNKVFS